MHFPAHTRKGFKSYAPTRHILSAYIPNAETLQELYFLIPAVPAAVPTLPSEIFEE